MKTQLDRRTFLAGTGALTLGGVPVGARAANTRHTIPFAKDGAFAEGVASGEPGTRTATLWTRLSGLSADRRVTLEIAHDPDFRRLALRRDMVARLSEGGAVKVRVPARAKLKPGERYWYRFATKTTSSPVGRFQTMRPPDSREPVRIAFFSCQDWQAGYYGAHRTIAEDDSLDFVLCLGDYIYEKNYYEGPREDRLGANGDGEVETREEYRQKYALYRSDADLRAMHAAHPFVPIWDDHEVEDNWAGATGGHQTPNRRVPYEQRRFNGLRTFYESMPLRRPERGGFKLYRSIPLGASAELFLLDERQYRDPQPCDDTFVIPCPEAETEPRRFLGDAQKAWLKGALEGSRAAWKLVANQAMIMALENGPSSPSNKDQWDGYGVERRDIMEHVASRNIQDVAFLTGDIHTFFAGEVGTDGRGPESVATEFVGGSITSLGIPESVESVSNVPADVVFQATQNFRTVNPHLKFDDQKRRGYGVVEARADELRVEFRAVEALRRTTTAEPIARFRVARGTPRVEVL
ncbi:MAG TPA: alkaline phosphatase D family protein [Thermoleophilaceae bacterium]|jgi:alkaline phosphatase D